MSYTKNVCHQISRVGSGSEKDKSWGGGLLTALHWSDSWTFDWKRLEKTLEKAVAPHSSTLAWRPHGRRSLVGCSPWGLEESDTTERLPFHFSLSCFGEGNGNPLQHSCLENPRDRGAWWAAVYGVAQSQTRLKQLSSSSSSSRGLSRYVQLRTI